MLVSYVQQKETWQGSSQQLLKFWKYISSNPDLSNWWPFWFNWPYPWDEKLWRKAWDERHVNNPGSATGEAARRYYSTKEFILSGARNVFSKPNIVYDNKFFDDFPDVPNNTWFRYDNTPLKESIKRYAKFPIATRFDKKEPRLLVISVDVEEAEVVTFDSYAKKDENGDIIRKSQYGFDEKEKKYTQNMEYDEGIMVEHTLASASVPVHYDYTLIPKKYDYMTKEEEREAKLKEDLQQNNLKNYRRFWDGGMLSNTPLRELIQSHQDYWKDIENAKYIPALEVYIVDVWPWMREKEGQYAIHSDYDSVIERKNELTYQDKTQYEETVANIVSDYFNFVTQTKNLLDEAINQISDVSKKNMLKKNLDHILNTKAKSTHRTGESRRYSDLLERKFDIIKVVRIERSLDPNDVSNKWCDFSDGTISELFKRGIGDALRTLSKDIKNNKGTQAASDRINAFINEAKQQKAEQDDDTYLFLIQSAEETKARLDSL